MRADRRTLLGAAILGIAALVAIFAPLLAPYSSREPSGPTNMSPSLQHPLGTDDAGVDVLSLVIWGARISMTVGVVATLVAMAVGGAIGITAGYVGGRLDGVLMRITDYFLVVPQIPLMIVVATIWGPSLSHIVIVIGLLNWTMTARLLRAQVKTLKQRTYVKRAAALGAGHLRIIRQHIAPQLGALLIANTVLTVANAIFSETALSFLGLGDPTAASWGSIMNNAFRSTAISNGFWWEILPAGLCVSIVVFGCSLLGVAIEERLNPRLRTSHISRRRFRVRPVPERSGADAD